MSTEQPDPSVAADDAFVPFAFTIVTVVAFVMYLPVMIRVLKALFSRLTSTASSREKDRGVDSEPDFFTEAKETLATIPRMIIYAVQRPGFVGAYATLLLKNKWIAATVCLPRALRWLLRPRYLVVILWCVLFSMAIYTNLSFDAYAVLGLPSDASTSDVKKAYRRLTKIYHPDFNKTEPARLIYARIRKAYKALVDTDTFEKEALQQDISVGVALPSFLTNRANDWIVMVGLLTLLVSVPMWLYKKFSGNDGERLTQCAKEILLNEERLIPLYAELGVPVEKRFVQRQREIDNYELIFTACSIPYPQRAALENLPPLGEFVKKVAQKDAQRTYFESLGIRPEQLIVLSDYIFSRNTEVQNVQDTGGEQITCINMPPAGKADAVLSLFRTIIDECEASIARFDGIIHGTIKVMYQLKKHHATTLELLSWAQEGRLSARDVDTLIEAPRVGRQLALSILPELQQIVQKRQKEYVKQQQRQLGMKHGRI